MSTKLSGMENPDFEDELVLLEGLKSKNIKAFAKLYKEYSEDLLLLAYTLTGDPALCHQAVDGLFIELWEKGSLTNIVPPIHHFLYSEIRKKCKK
jgi:DNA-directed RNA polymerase specialized sigma24 family protein